MLKALNTENRCKGTCGGSGGRPPKLLKFFSLSYFTNDSLQIDYTRETNNGNESNSQAVPLRRPGERGTREETNHCLIALVLINNAKLVDRRHWQIGMSTLVINGKKRFLKTSLSAPLFGV